MELHAVPDPAPSEDAEDQATTDEPTEATTDEVVEASGEADIPQIVPPMPLPEVWHVNKVQMPGGGEAVQIVISGPGGLAYHFLDDTSGMKIGVDIANTAESLSKLVVPPTSGGGLVGPDGAPLSTP